MIEIQWCEEFVLLIQKQNKHFHFSYYVSLRLFKQMTQAAASTDTCTLFPKNICVIFWRDKKETSIKVMRYSVILTCYFHISVGGKKDIWRHLSYTSSFQKQQPATTSLYLHDEWKDARHFNPTNPAAEGWAVSVNSIYSYTDESDVLTPGCNMLFCNFY